MEHYSNIRKKKIMPFAATWMDLEIAILSEVSQTEKDKYHILLLICGTLKYNTNELIYKTEMDLYRKQCYGYQMEQQWGREITGSLGLTYIHSGQLLSCV